MESKYFIKHIVISIILTCFSISSYEQVKYGFIKPNDRPLIINDIDESKDHNSKWSDTMLLTHSTYFRLLNTDSSKFEISVVGYKYLDGDTREPNLSNFRTYLDSSEIIQFDFLGEAEKGRRIKETFDKKLMVWSEYKNDENYSKSQLLFYESTYSSMRDEFIKHWVKNKNEMLLLEYFKILYCCTGDDGMDSRTVGSLFCLAPDDFCKILNKQSKKNREYIVYRLTDGGIAYHVASNMENNGSSDEIEKKFKSLLYSKVK